MDKQFVKVIPHFPFLQFITKPNWIQHSDTQECAYLITPPLINYHAHLNLNPTQPYEQISDFGQWVQKVVNPQVQAQFNNPKNTLEQRKKNAQIMQTNGDALIFDHTSGVQTTESIAGVINLWEYIQPEKTARAYNSDLKYYLNSYPFLAPHAPFSVHDDFLPVLKPTLKVLSCHILENEYELALGQMHSQTSVVELYQKRREQLKSFLLKVAPEIAHDAIFNTLPSLEYYLKKLLESTTNSYSQGITQSTTLMLWVHANYLFKAIHEGLISDRLIQLLQVHPHFRIVHCPTSHAYFKHPPFDWEQAQKYQFKVVLGTDSPASRLDNLPLGVKFEVDYLLVHKSWPLKVLLQTAFFNHPQTIQNWGLSIGENFIWKIPKFTKEEIKIIAEKEARKTPFVEKIFKEKWLQAIYCESPLLNA